MCFAQEWPFLFFTTWMSEWAMLLLQTSLPIPFAVRNVAETVRTVTLKEELCLTLNSYNSYASVSSGPESEHALCISNDGALRVFGALGRRSEHDTVYK